MYLYKTYLIHLHFFATINKISDSEIKLKKMSKGSLPDECTFNGVKVRQKISIVFSC